MQIGVSYFGNRILKHVKSDMRDLKQKGFTFVLHTYSEFDFQFRAETMKEIFKITHDEGLDVWVNPWGVGNVFGGEPFSNFASKNIFTSCQVLDDNNPTSIACPNSPEFNGFLDSWIETVVDSGVDTILWDEPHFHEQGFLSSIPDRWGCRCKFCKSKFEDEFNYPMPIIETEEVKAFKKKSLISFIERLSNKVKKSNVKNTLYLTANLSTEEVDKEWESLFNIKSIDTFATGPYWQWAEKPVEHVAEYAKIILEMASKKNKNSQIWIQGFRIKAGREDELSKAISMATDSGIKNIAIWGYEGCSQESWVTCDNPELVWKKILDPIDNLK